MIIKGNSIEEINHRKDYKVRGLQDQIRHFVVFTTTPDNPFRPHKHAGLEFWHILEGEAVVTLDGEDYAVEAGDLVFLAPWTEHGLRTGKSTRWICLGQCSLWPVAGWRVRRYNRKQMALNRVVFPASARK